MSAGRPEDAKPFFEAAEKFKPEVTKPTADVGNYEYYAAQETKQGRVPLSFAEYTKARSGGTNVNVGPQEKKFEEEVGKTLAKKFETLSTAGSTSFSALGDIAAMEELLAQGPQGIVEGYIASLVPGISAPAEAIQSIINRVAPTLRVEGSGSTSDKEYAGMLASFPKLYNTPEGNQLILQIMKDKAQINLELGEISDMYYREEISKSEALKRIGEVNKRPLMSNELRAKINALSKFGSKAGSTNAPPTVDEITDDVNKYLNP